MNGAYIVTTILLCAQVMCAFAGDHFGEIHRKVDWFLAPFEPFEATQKTINNNKINNNVNVNNSTIGRKGIINHYLRVAVLAAGDLRVFSFVEKSWTRSLLRPPGNAHANDVEVHLFAHVVNVPACPLAKLGLHRLQKLATEYELASSEPLYSASTVLSKLPAHYANRERWRYLFLNANHSRGNFIDMHARRERVYNMALHYALRRGWHWDLFVMTRTDLAFYDPVINLRSIYNGLVGYNNAHSAHGLPREMAVYFKHDYVFEVLSWSQLPDNATESVRPHMAPYAINEELNFTKSYMGGEGSSEHMLEMWFVMKNLTQLMFYYRPAENFDVTGFVTMRLEHAMAYCANTRWGYTHKYPDPNNFSWDPDRVTAYPINDGFSEASRWFARAGGFDSWASFERRCGKQQLAVNATEVCQRFAGCHCKPNDIYLVYDDIPLPF